MNLWADILPLVAFFALYRLQGIYAATLGAIVLSVAAAIYKYRTQGKLEPLPLLGMGLMIVLGGLTVYLKDPRFLLWKPTLAYLATAIFFAASCRSGGTPVAQQIFQGALLLTPRLWRQATLAYVAFFVAMACLNLIVAYSVSLDTWVKFKVFGTLGLMFAFVLGHARYYGSKQPADLCSDLPNPSAPDLGMTPSEP